MRRRRHALALRKRRRIRRPSHASPPRVLVTGFGPFPGVAVNPTTPMVHRLRQHRRLNRAPVRLFTAVLETAWRELDALPRLIRRCAPHLVLMLGVHTRSHRVRFEMLADISANPSLPDTTGARPPAVSLGGNTRTLRTRAALAPLVRDASRRGIPAQLSADAGRYLCNAAYRTALGVRIPGRIPRRILFVHIPRPRPARGLRPADLDGLVVRTIGQLTGVRIDGTRRRVP